MKLAQGTVMNQIAKRFRKTLPLSHHISLDVWTNVRDQRLAEKKKQRDSSASCVIVYLAHHRLKKPEGGGDVNATSP